MNKTYAVLVQSLCVGLALIILSACGSPSAPPPSAPAVRTEPAGPPVDGDWLILHLLGEPAHLNPITSSEVPASFINGSIFESLLDMDNETLALIPRVAESWEASLDHLTYTFKLYHNACFSDGTPLTARDVKFTFDKVMDPTTDAPHLRNYFQDVTACEVLDDYAVRYTFKKPYFKHLRMLGGLEILPRHIYGTGDFNKHPNNRRPLGSGPYVLERWDTGMQVVLARNEKYWKQKPHPLKRVFKFITNATAAFQVLDRQEMDYMNLTPELWVNRASTPEFEAKFNKYRYYGASYSYIGWNLRHPQFQDKMVRRALTMLLDRKLILETIYYNLGKQVTNHFFVESPEYDADIRPWPFDPEQAKLLLDGAGWKDANGDGIRDKDGVPFRFELLIRSGASEDEQIATVYQEELKRAQIDMVIRSLEWATFLQRVDSRDFDAVRLAWSEPPIDDDPFQVWHSSQADKGSDFVGFKNEEADRIMEEARLEFDQAKRIAMYHRFDSILHEEQPYTFMFCIQELEALDKRFAGVKVYKFGLDSREWWVPLNLQRYH
jgi:peptide/nickel transport system substrate-binding protein